MRKNDALKTREFYQSLGTADDETIGRLFGISKPTVAYERRKLGIPNVRKKWKRTHRSDEMCRAAERRENLAREYEELGTCQKVAELHGLSRQRVHQIISKRRKET